MYSFLLVGKFSFIFCRTVSCLPKETVKRFLQEKPWKVSLLYNLQEQKLVNHLKYMFVFLQASYGGNERFLSGV